SRLLHRQRRRDSSQNPARVGRHLAGVRARDTTRRRTSARRASCVVERRLHTVVCMRPAPWMLLLGFAQAGCLEMAAPLHPGSSSAPSTVKPPLLPDDAFVTLKSPADAHAELCANDGMHPRFPDDADTLTRTFCQDVKPGGKMPQPASLADL